MIIGVSLSLRNPLAEAKFPAFPVITGIFAISPDEPRSACENRNANQSLAGKFPLPRKREFAMA